MPELASLGLLGLVGGGSFVDAQAQTMPGGGAAIVQPYSVVELRTSTGDLFWTSEDTPLSVSVVEAIVTEDRTRDSEHLELDVTLRIDAHDQEMIELLVPNTDTHQMAPLQRTQVVMFAGAVLDDGTTEVVPAGFGLIDQTRVQRDELGVTVSVRAVDPSRQLVLARIIGEWTLATQPKTTWISTWLTQVLGPDWPREITPNGSTTQRTVVDDQTSRWDLMSDMARNGLGYRHGFDRRGVYVAQPTDVFTDGISWLLAGDEARYLGQLTSETGDDNVYSGIVVRGESAASTSSLPPVQAIVWDTDPTSATYFDPDNASASKIGPRPAFVQSQFVYTSSQALRAARSRLPEVTTISQLVAFEVRYNPTMVPYDMIYFDVPDVGISGQYQIAARRLDLAGGPMTVACAQRGSQAVL